jgi:hypothetical protein
VTLPASARLVSTAITEAVATAGSPSSDAASARLVALDREQVRRVLGTVIRLLLEESHPGGVDADALRDALSAVVATHGADPPTAAYVLLGADGATDPDSDPPPAETLLPTAAQTIATLLAGRPLAPHLAAAFADLHRAETLDYFH